MTALFLSAFGLGLIFNASPGAVFAETVRRGIAGGYVPAFYVQIGSLAGDATWAVLGLAGAGILLQLPAVQAPLSVLGTAYLAWLGLKSCFSRTDPRPAAGGARTGTMDKGALASGASLSLTNPANIFYWAALGGVLGALGVADPKPVHYLVFFAGFMASSLLWCFACAWLVHILHRTMSARMTMLINVACGLALLYLAARSIMALDLPAFDPFPFHALR